MEPRLQRGPIDRVRPPFLAQDNYGNAWYMGEYLEEYTDGKFEVAPICPILLHPRPG